MDRFYYHISGNEKAIKYLVFAIVFAIPPVVLIFLYDANATSLFLVSVGMLVLAAYQSFVNGKNTTTVSLDRSGFHYKDFEGRTLTKSFGEITALVRATENRGHETDEKTSHFIIFPEEKYLSVPLPTGQIRKFRNVAIQLGIPNIDKGSSSSYKRDLENEGYRKVDLVSEVSEVSE